MVKNQIEAETEKVRKGFEEEMLGPTSELIDIVKLPKKGSTNDEILEMTKAHLSCGSFDWKQGTFLPVLYHIVRN
jgi:hypothetical protein